MNLNKVTLPPTVARCPDTRTKPCQQAATCAKALVLHSKDRPTQDYSIEARGANGACNHYLPASDFRKPPDVAQRPAHDFIKGLV